MARDQCGETQLVVMEQVLEIVVIQAKSVHVSEREEDGDVRLEESWHR